MKTKLDVLYLTCLIELDIMDGVFENTSLEVKI